MSEQLSVHDLHDLLQEVWAKHKDTPPSIMVRPDGFYEEGESDSDDGPLTEGDVVRWNLWKTRLIGGNLEPFGGRRPYMLGTVVNADPEACLDGHVGVRMSNGAGGQFQRNLLRRHGELL